ncbi:GumC family protein [Oceanidesulfovibrio marinus]|uniref:Polysaccharide chain length determinant protein, PEP-CTERM locus subfamily n=1 Tax=Oceanidesulfovibrio marinus TaxID=370038 RepID=A0A6P1ZEN2_9BACT|nr:GumC family protein [Oceanidesulfovibrio marinus]TVM32071.1 hypothetical protein DQK91_16180 [Oceanidesulfovibrio marinus]
MTENESRNMSLRDVLNFVFKYQKRILWIFFSVFIVLAAVLFLMRPVYESTARIIIQIGRENVYTPMTSDSQQLFDFSVDQRINSKVELLTGVNSIERTIKALGVKNVYPDIDSRPYVATRFFNFPLPSFSDETDMQKAIMLFKKNLDASRKDKTDFVEVAFNHPDPVIAQAALAKLVDIFIQEHVNLYQESERYKFLVSQVDSLRNDLEQSEANLKTFKSEHNIASLFQEKTILLELKATAEQKLLDTQSDISENQGRLDSLQSSGTAEFGQETDLNPISISEIRRMIAELRLREEQYLNDYTAKNPLVIGIRKEIRTAESLLHGEEQAYHDKAKLSIIHTLESLHTKEARLLAKHKDYDRQLQELVDRETALKDLERKVSINEDNYKLYVKKLEESRISKEMDEQGIINVSTVDPPTLPIKAVKPKIGMGLGIAALVGVLIAMLVSLYSEYFSHTMNSAEEVHRWTGLDVVAILPDAEESSEKKRRISQGELA